MEFFHSPWIIFPLTIGILVFIHELGHYLIGILFKIGVISFSIGFGPKLFSFNRNHTQYKVCLLPLGGYVQFAGMTTKEQVSEEFVGKEFYSKPWWQRSLVIFAGPFANLLLAVVAYSFISYVGIAKTQAIIGFVKPNYPADLAGILPNDKIVSINHKPVNFWEDIHREFKKISSQYSQDTLKNSSDSSSPSPTKFNLPITVERNGKVLDLAVSGEFEKKQLRIGIAPWFFAPSIISFSDYSSHKSGIIAGSVIKQFSIDSQQGDFSSIDHSNSSSNSDNDQVIYTLNSDHSFVDFTAMLNQALLQHLQKLQPQVYSFLSSNSSNYQVISKLNDINDRWKIKLLLQPPVWDQSYNDTSPHSFYNVELYFDFKSIIKDHPDKKPHHFSKLVLDHLDIQLAGLVVTNKSFEKNGKNFSTILNPGDYIIQAGDRKLANIYDWYDVVEDYQQKHQMEIKVIREGKEIDINLPGKSRVVDTLEGPKKVFNYQIKLGPEIIPKPKVLDKEDGILASIASGITKSLTISGFMLKVLYEMVTGKVSVRSIGGPIMIGQVASESASKGLISYLFVLAIISINLFVINLIPIPALDGGQLVLVGMEALRRRPMSMKFIENYQKIGFVLILSLMVLAFYNDLSKIWLNFFS